MRELCWSFFLLVLVMKPGLGQIVGPSSEENAVVYFFRESLNADIDPSALNQATLLYPLIDVGNHQSHYSSGTSNNRVFCLYDTNKVIGKLATERYIRYECNAGYHLFWSRGKSYDYVEADLAPGKIYFVKIIAKAIERKSPDLTPVYPDNDFMMNEARKFISSNKAEEYTNDEFQNLQKTHRKKIKKGLMRYEADVSKGFLPNELSKDMYYDSPTLVNKKTSYETILLNSYKTAREEYNLGDLDVIAVNYDRVSEYKYCDSSKKFVHENTLDIKGPLVIGPLTIFIQGSDNQPDGSFDIIKKMREEETRRSIFLCNLADDTCSISVSGDVRELVLINKTNMYIYRLTPNVNYEETEDNIEMGHYPILSESVVSDSEEPIYMLVERMPSFPGGQEVLYDYLGKNIKYPDNAKARGIEGTVYVTFVVERDGSISDVRLLRGIGGGCDKEAIRVVRSMPEWNPGYIKGNPVRVQFNLPVKYIIDKRKNFNNY